MYRVVFTDDFGATEPDKKLQRFVTKGEAERIVRARNREIERRGLEEFGLWRVMETRERDRGRGAHAGHKES